MDGYTNFAADFQYDRTIAGWKNDVLTVRGSYIRENSNLQATLADRGVEQISHHLNTAQAHVEYHFGTKLSTTAGVFAVSGTRDPLLFAQADVAGSANGSPQSTGYILNVSCWPQQNVNLAVQYMGYTRFHGAQPNYDGVGGMRRRTTRSACSRGLCSEIFIRFPFATECFFRPSGAARFRLSHTACAVSSILEPLRGEVQCEQIWLRFVAG